jgi:sterol 3beta-glucosyltransferase
MAAIDMRIAVLCNDTRGGVQPYAGLVRGLLTAGYDVTCIAPVDLCGLFDSGARIAALPETADVAAFAATGLAEKGTMAAMRLMARELPRRLAVWTRAARDACEGADILTGGIGGMAMGLPVAEAMGVPFIPAHLQPVDAPTQAYPGVLFPAMPRWTGSLGRALSHRLSDAGVWLPFRRAMALARAEVFGRRKRRSPVRPDAVLYGFSRHVVPLAVTNRRHVTGYWTLPAESGWQPSDAMRSFLDQGRPVVSVGFGSMGSADPAALGALVTEAARQAGVRVVMQAGWHGMSGAASDDVFPAGDVPHDWLFPRMAANVHHGGAGTTGAALSAGRPSVFVPFAVDQPFWASRAAALGVAPEAIPRRQLTATGLARAISSAVSDGAMQERAADLGARLRAENGAAVAVAVFDGLSRGRAAG